MGNHVPTPVGERCLRCGRRIEVDDQGVFRGADTDSDVDAHMVPGPLHRECSERGVGVLERTSDKQERPLTGAECRPA
jgi:hypothetical protein